MGHGGRSADDGLYASAGRRQGLRLGEIGVDDCDLCRNEWSCFFMTGSAANEPTHGASLATEIEGNLLTDKTCGTDDEIHRYPPLMSLGALKGRTEILT